MNPAAVGWTVLAVAALLAVVAMIFRGLRSLLDIVLSGSTPETRAGLVRALAELIQAVGGCIPGTAARARAREPRRSRRRAAPDIDPDEEDGDGADGDEEDARVASRRIPRRRPPQHDHSRR